MKKWIQRISYLALSITFLTLALTLQAQDGDAGINKANDMVRGYFNTAVNLLYAIGGVFGIIGAIKVYKIWVNNEGHAATAAAAWFSACIFLVLVATILRSFFAL